MRRLGGRTWWSQTAQVRIPALPLAKVFNLSVPLLYSEGDNGGTRLRVLGNVLRTVPGPESVFSKRQLLLIHHWPQCPVMNQDSYYAACIMFILRDVHVPIPRTCDCVAFHGKMDFAGAE